MCNVTGKVKIGKNWLHHNRERSTPGVVVLVPLVAGGRPAPLCGESRRAPHIRQEREDRLLQGVLDYQPTPFTLL